MDEDILYFQLSDEALKKRIRGGEKFVGYSILALGILIFLSLLFLEVPFRWPYLIGGLIFLWLFIESGTYLIRKQRLKHWGNYKIGYENKVIFELRNNEKNGRNFSRPCHRN